MINLTLACKKYNVIYFENWHSVQSKNQRMALRLFVTVQISWNKKIKKTSICIQVCYVYIFFSTLNSFVYLLSWLTLRHISAKLKRILSFTSQMKIFPDMPSLVSVTW